MRNLTDLTTEELGSLLEFDENNIIAGLKDQARLFFSVSEKCAKMDTALTNASNDLKELSAEKALALKAASTGGRLTEKTIEYKLEVDPDIKALKARKASLEYSKNLFTGLLRALEHRREMLKSASYAVSKEGFI